MNSIRASLAVLFVLAFATFSFAAITPTAPVPNTAITSATPSLSTILAEGPAPRPLCEPGTTVCPSLPTARPDVTIAEGPAPRPLCEPGTTVCPSLPTARSKAVMGFAV